MLTYAEFYKMVVDNSVKITYQVFMVISIEFFLSWMV